MAKRNYFGREGKVINYKNERIIKSMLHEYTVTEIAQQLSINRGTIVQFLKRNNIKQKIKIRNSIHSKATEREKKEYISIRESINNCKTKTFIKNYYKRIDELKNEKHKSELLDVLIKKVAKLQALNPNN